MFIDEQFLQSCYLLASIAEIISIQNARRYFESSMTSVNERVWKLFCIVMHVSLLPDYSKIFAQFDSKHITKIFFI